MCIHGKIGGKLKMQFPVLVNQKTPRISHEIYLHLRDWPISSEGSKHELQRKREKRIRKMADVEVGLRLAVNENLKAYEWPAIHN